MLVLEYSDHMSSSILTTNSKHVGCGYGSSQPYYINWLDGQETTYGKALL